nr:MAG TPA_asm: hypothetical protein [Caudoviricetes sp.]
MLRIKLIISRFILISKQAYLTGSLLLRWSIVLMVNFLIKSNPGKSGANGQGEKKPCG